MIYKSEKALFKETAEEVKLPPEVVEIIIKHADRQVSKTLGGITNDVCLPIIGTYTFHRKGVNREIRETIKLIRKLENSKRLSRTKNVEELTQAYYYLKSLLKVRNQLAKKTILRNLRRIEYYNKLKAGEILPPSNQTWVDKSELNNESNLVPVKGEDLF